MIGYDEEDGFYGEFIFGDRGFTPPGYEGELWKYYWQNCDYAISNYGRVWSCRSNKFLQPFNTNGYGHLMVNMYCNRIMNQVYIHRLVAESFIPNPNNLPLVRHLDGDPTNNVVWNLAWGTTKDNWEDSVKHGTAAMPSQPIVAISESDGSQIWFSSQIEAARELKLNQGNISNCLEGRQHHTGGYSFVRAEGGEVSADSSKQLY